MGQLVIEFDSRKGEIRMSGKIDENSDFSKFQVGLLARVNIDLDGVTSINSIGIRKWVEWISSLPSSMKLMFLRCPKVAVEQFNVVQNFLPANAAVMSFFVPYYCEALDETLNVLYEYGKDYGPGPVKIRKEVPCGPGNSKIAVLDVIEKQYFKFLEGRT